MTELVLALGLATLGLAVAAHLVRWVMLRVAGDGELAHHATRVRNALEPFARRQAGMTAATSALVGGGLFLAYGLRSGQHDVLPGLESGVWLAGSFALGVAGAIASAHAAVYAGVRATVRTAAAVRSSTNEALEIAARGGAIPGLVAMSGSALVLGGLALALAVRRGAWSMPTVLGDSVGHALPWHLLGCPLGAGLGALLLVTSSGIFAKSSDISADLGAREAGLDEDDPANPATVVALAGDLSEAGSRSAQAFALAVTEDVVAMLALGAAYEANTSLRSAIGLLLVPVLSRAFSVLGGAFGVFTVRTDDREDPLAALHRARLIASALHVVGLAGALEWLVPNHRGPLLGPALLGVALSFGLAWFAQYLTSPRDRPVRELADVSRGGPSFGILGGVELGLRAAVVPLAATSFAIVGALWLGMRSGMSGGAHLAMAGLIAGAAGGSTTGLALECCGGMLDGAAGLVAATTGRARREVRGRMLVLDAAGSTYRLLGRLRNASSALLLIAPTLAVLRAETVRRPTQSSSMSFEVAAAIAVPCALAGAALVAWFFARTSAATLASARRLLDEVQRQLRDRPARRTHGPMTLGEQEPADAQPCVEIASRLALQQALLGIAAVCAPIPFALGLRLVEIADKEGVAFVAAVTTLVATMIAGVLGALVASTAGGTWGNAKRYIVTGAHGGRLLVDETGAPTENPTYFAAVVADTVGDSLKDVASPAVLAYVTLLPILALALLPLLL